MKNCVNLLLTLMLSTTMVFASEGMKTLTPAFRLEQVQKILKEQGKSKQQLIRKLNKAIAKLERSPNRYSMEKILPKVEKRLTKGIKGRKRAANKLLKNKAEFTRSFNFLKAIDENLTQYEYHQRLLQIAKTEELENSKFRTLQNLKKAGSMKSYLLDFKAAVENDKIDQFAKVKTSFQNSRAIASFDSGINVVIAIDVILAVLMIVGIVAVGTTTGSIAAVVGLSVLAPFALIIIFFVGGSIAYSCS